jgi:hypothetical protein
MVLRYLPDAVLVNNNFIEYDNPGSVPAALISAVNIAGDKVQGWITCGNYLNSQKILQLDSLVSLVMTDPIPRKFSSFINIYAPNHKIFQASVEVNKPCRVNGWCIYQSGYDSDMGKWSTTSILEMVKDPWLEIVYTGFILLLIGSVFLIINGRKTITPDL